MTVQSRLGRAADPRKLSARFETCEGRRRLSSPLLLCAIALFGAPIVASAAPPAGAAATPELGSADGEQSGTRAVVTDLKRAGDTVTLKFVIYNDTGTDLAIYGNYTDTEYAGYLSFSGVHLLDGTGRKKYYAVKDSDRNCVCSDNIKAVPAKTSMTLWVKYPAPPDSTQKVTVQIPHFLPIEDVPIH